MLFLTRVMTATLAASWIVSVWPSRDLTIRFWPSSLSTVPRMRVGVPVGGVWARAGQTTKAMRAAIAIFRIIQTPVCVSREETRKRWRTRTRLSAHIPVNGGVGVARFAKQGMEILQPAGAARDGPPRGARQFGWLLEAGGAGDFTKAVDSFARGAVIINRLAVNSP